MHAIKTPIKGCYIIQFDTFADQRGFFEESYHSEKFLQLPIPSIYLQDNTSTSNPYVLRGLHYQKTNPQGKLVRCLYGSAWDVCVDIRPNSHTFGRWFAHVIHDKNREGLYIPEGCAHGFAVLGNSQAVLHYKCTSLYNSESDTGIRYDDPFLKITWPGSDFLISEKDLNLPYLKDVL